MSGTFLFATASTNFCFQYDTPSMPYCEPTNINFNLTMNLSDSVLLVIYLALNNFIWTHGSVLWCTLPKIAWCIAFYFYFPDRVPDLVASFLFSFLLNVIHVVACEEVMVAVHRGAKGRHCQTKIDVEDSLRSGQKVQFYEEHRPLILSPVCTMNPIEFFVSINLDLRCIWNIVIVNRFCKGKGK